jgi:hypothetical protein
LTVLLTLVSLISYCQYPTAKTIGKDSVVIITTKQAEKINKIHTKLLDSIAIVKDEAYNLAYYKLETVDKLYDLENRLDAYKAYVDIKDKEIETLKSKKRSPILVTMLLLIGWTLYTGIQTQTIK